MDDERIVEEIVTSFFSLKTCRLRQLLSLASCSLCAIKAAVHCALRVITRPVFDEDAHYIPLRPIIILH